MSDHKITLTLKQDQAFRDAFSLVESSLDYLDQMMDARVTRRIPGTTNTHRHSIFDDILKQPHTDLRRALKVLESLSDDVVIVKEGDDGE